jgi:hypothetical protein
MLTSQAIGTNHLLPLILALPSQEVDGWLSIQDVPSSDRGCIDKKNQENKFSNIKI